MELGKVKAKIEKIAKTKNVSVQVAWDTFFFDEFMKRLSKSEYKHNFIFKGGFYLQNVLGVETRSTMDIDFKYSGNNITDKSLCSMVYKIISEGNNEVSFTILSVDDIKAETKYGGKTVKLEARFYNVKKRFGIDIGIGDVVTPNPITFRYVCSVNDESFDVFAYSIETAIAEKFETLISKGTNNSRSKDLVDLYLLHKKGYDKTMLSSAMINTFFLRGTQYDDEMIRLVLYEVFSFERIKELYENYRRKNNFVREISFDDCKNSIYSIFDDIRFHKKVLLKEYNVVLHLVRHCEADIEKIGGWTDNQLTERGIEQAYELKEQIDDEYDVFISSDLKRTLQTSNILNEKLGMSIRLDTSFREINNGMMKNMRIDEFKKGGSRYAFSRLNMNECYPEGESPVMFFERIKTAFTKLLEDNRNKKILLVTHGGVITVIKCLLEGLEYSNLLKIAPQVGTISVYK